MYKLEFEKYQKYIASYYPETYIIQSHALQRIHQSINKNIKFLDVMRKVEKNISSERDRLYNDFKLLHLRALYHLPSNDEYINNIMVRTISENIFRITVSIICPESEEIIEMSFNTMKNKLNEKGFSYRHKQFYDNLTNYFGRYSKDVHGQTVTNYSQEEYLTMIRKKNTNSHLQSLLGVYDAIFEDLTVFMLKEIRVSQSEQPVAVLSALMEIIGEEKYNQLTKS